MIEARRAPDGTETLALTTPAMKPTGEHPMASAKTWTRRALGLWPAAVLFLAILAVWQYYVESRNIPPLYVPAPLEIAQELAGNLGFFWSNAWVTLQEAALAVLIGSVIAGVAAALMAEFSIADRALLPAFVVIKVIPPVTLVPVLVVALGLGIWPKVVIATMTLFYVVFINAVTGFKSIDAGALDLMRSVNASRLEILLRLRLPNSLPHLFAGAKIGFPLAVLGAMFAEFHTSKAGLGNVITVAAARTDMQAMWAAIFVLMILGVTIVGAIGILETPGVVPARVPAVKRSGSPKGWLVALLVITLLAAACGDDGPDAGPSSTVEERDHRPATPHRRRAM